MLRPDLWRHAPTPSLLAASWALFIASNVADWLVSRQPNDTARTSRGTHRPSGTARQRLTADSSHSPSDVKPTITTSIQYCDRVAWRASE
jgi:hypothetical protein